MKNFHASSSADVLIDSLSDDSPSDDFPSDDSLSDDSLSDDSFSDDSSSYVTLSAMWLLQLCDSFSYVAPLNHEGSEAERAEIE